MALASILMMASQGIIRCGGLPDCGLDHDWDSMQQAEAPGSVHTRGQ